MNILLKYLNPTDEEHELIIDSKIDGKTSEVARSGDIEPGEIVEFKFKAEEARDLVTIVNIIQT